MQEAITNMVQSGQELAQYLMRRGFNLQEGGVLAEQQYFFSELLRTRPEIQLVGEIGFNAGFSAVTFLGTREDTSLISFDLMEYDYSEYCKSYVNEEFPGRHTLVPGDSTKTVLAWKAENTAVQFDLIFIDGGHDSETACADIDNMRRLAHSNTLVVMDDLVPEKSWGEGPTYAWNQAIEQGKIREITRCETTTRRWGVGTYII